MAAPISPAAPRRRGRPQSPAGRGKTTTVHFRLTDVEKTGVGTKSAALGVKPARVYRRLVREFLTGEPDYFGAELRELRRGCDQLSRVGNNLNQLVRLAHQGECPMEADLLALLESVLGSVQSLHGLFGASVRHAAERRT